MDTDKCFFMQSFFYEWATEIWSTIGLLNFKTSGHFMLNEYNAETYHIFKISAPDKYAYRTHF